MFFARKKPVAARLRAGVSYGVLVCALAAIGAPAAQADDFLGLGFLAGGNSSQATGISADGTVVVGNSTVGGVNRGYVWINGTMTDLGSFIPGGATVVNAVAPNGTLEVGSSLTASGYSHAFVTIPGLFDLGTLGGNASEAYSVSDNGIVVGRAQTAAGDYHAFRHDGITMHDLGTLGGLTSIAYGVSADGTIVVGTSDNGTTQDAFLWTGGVMTDLGSLAPGAGSSATAISADGHVVVGSSGTGTPGEFHAFRLVVGGTMTDLGTLGGTISYATAVSANGSVVVGTSTTATATAEAFRWTTSSGMKSIPGLLTAAGVNITGWTLDTASGVSADGSVVVGSGTDPNGNGQAWLARFSPDGTGLITPGVVAQSFSGQAAIGENDTRVIDGTLETFTQVATKDSSGQGKNGSPYSVFGYTTGDSDPAAAGLVGLKVALPDSIVAGVAVAANYVKTDLVYDGSSKMHGGSIGGFIARVPDTGLQWLVGVDGLTLKGNIDRGYLSGSGQAYSTGSTTANGWGANARIGWSFDKILANTRLTPFASYSYSTIHVDGYTETTGVFPATFNAFNDTMQIARFGADLRYAFGPDKWVWGTLNEAHRFGGSKSDDITGTLIGLFTVTAAPAPVAQDWAEATAGLHLPVWVNGSLTASVTALIPADYPTTYVGRLGLTQTF
jgi:probable HAF family extracellular repeat protein